MKIRQLSLMIAMILCVAMTSVGASAQTLYGIEFQMSPHLWTIDKGTGNALTDIGAVTVSGYQVVGARGMATNPTDGTLYAILYANDVVLPAIEGHLLVTVNTATAHGTLIVMLDQGIRDLTFDASGHLYGVSGGPNQSSIPDHLFAIDKTTGALTDLGPAGTNGSNPRNHALAFMPSNPGVLYHRYGSTGFETIEIVPPYTRTEIGTNDIGMLINVSLVFDNDSGLFRTAENPGGGGVPYTWVTIDENGVRTDLGIDLPVILNGLAFDQAGTIGDALFVDGFELGDTTGWSAVVQ